MRRITKIAGIAVVAILIIAAFVYVVPSVDSIPDMNDDDATDNVDTDGDDIPNIDDDDIDGDGTSNDDSDDDDGDGIPDADDDDPEIPSDDDDGDGIPDVLEPIVVITVKGIKIQFVANNIAHPTILANYEDGVKPVVDIVPYTGTEAPVYEWEETKPLFTWPGTVDQTSTVTVEYWVSAQIVAEFDSFEYVYEDINGITTDRFLASWNSSHETDDITCYNVDRIIDLPTDAWNYDSWDTGRCYLWEQGKYSLNLRFDYIITNADGLTIRGNIPLYPIYFEVVMG
jgi:hypothetical protein